MAEGFHISRGSLPGWLSSGALVLGIVGYFFYERASDEKWMALEEQSFDAINERLSAIESNVGHIREAIAHHRGEHGLSPPRPAREPLAPYPPRDRHP